MELYPYMRDLLLDDGNAAREKCERVVSGLCEKYRLTVEERAELRETIVAYVEAAMDNTYDTMLAEGVDLGKEQMFQDVKNAYEDMMALEIAKAGMGIHAGD